MIIKFIFLIIIHSFYSCTPSSESVFDDNHTPGMDLSQAPVSLNITPPSFDQDSDATITLSYTDAEGDLATSCSISSLVNVTITAACSCVLGTCTVGVRGTAGHHGLASFNYTVTSNGATSNFALASLTINQVNAMPVIAGMQFWLDFSDQSTIFTDTTCTTQIQNGEAIACIQNKGSVTDTITQSTAIRRPTWGGDHASFIRADVQFLISTANYNMNSRSIFVVQEPQDSSHYGTIIINGSAHGSITNFFHLYQNTDYCLNIAGGGACEIAFGAAPLSTLALIYGSNNSGNTTIKASLNGAAPTSAAGMATISNDKLIIGSYSAAGNSYEGRIYEIVAFDTELSDLNRQKVEGYLTWKWGIQNSLPIGHPYRDVMP